MANKIYLVKQDDIHAIDGTSLMFMHSKEVVINKEKIDKIYYINNEELADDGVNAFWEKKKRGNKRFTFLKLKPNTPVEIFKDRTADFFDNAEIVDVKEKEVIIKISRVLRKNQLEIQG